VIENRKEHGGNTPSTTEKSEKKTMMIQSLMFLLDAEVLECAVRK
jgi:hypothetical protein